MKLFKVLSLAVLLASPTVAFAEKPDKSEKQAEKDARKAEKAADKAAKEAEKDARKAAKQAEKDARKAEK